MNENRFNYIKYDEEAQRIQSEFKDLFTEIDDLLTFNLARLHPSREISLVRTKLEEAYMWVGKAIREDQINRTQKVELQEERANS